MDDPRIELAKNIYAQTQNQKETAEIMGLSQPTVSRLLSRAYGFPWNPEYEVAKPEINLKEDTWSQRWLRKLNRR